MTGSVDLQVNGYAGVDFNADGLTAEQLHTVCERLQADGVAGILATVITDDLEAMYRRLMAIVAHREQDELARQIIWGLHVEGPFLNETPGYIGAHPAEHARPADDVSMQKLLEAGGGLVKIVTLSPECDRQQRVTRLLADQGIVVSAGHCDPTLDELDASIDAGLSMFTHLGNGCPMQLHRHDNVIQRVLSRADRLWISFIADGAHIPLNTLGNYLRLTGARACLVTDAISAAGLGPGTYTLANQSIDIGDDLVPWAADRSHFIGSATTMPRMVENLRSMEIDETTIDALLCQRPRAILGMA